MRNQNYLAVGCSMLLAACGLLNCAFGEDDPVIDEKPLSQLIKQLRSENRGLQMRAAQALSSVPTNMHERIMPQVLPILKSERENDKFVAAQVLGTYGPASRVAIPDLLPMLKGTQYERNRAAAAKALGQILTDAKSDKEVDEVTAALIEAFKDPYEDVRREAVTACGMIGPAAKACIAHLTPRLKEQIDYPPNAVAMAAAWTCERMGPLAKEHVDLLITLVHRVMGYTPAYILALGAIGPVQENIVPNILDNMEQYTAGSVAPWQVLAKFGPKAAAAVPLLTRLLRERRLPAPVAIQAVKALKTFGPAAGEAVPVLKEYLGAKDVGDFYSTPSMRYIQPVELVELKKCCQEVVEAITGKK